MPTCGQVTCRVSWRTSIRLQALLILGLGRWLPFSCEHTWVDMRQVGTKLWGTLYVSTGSDFSLKNGLPPIRASPLTWVLEWENLQSSSSQTAMLTVTREKSKSFRSYCPAKKFNHTSQTHCQYLQVPLHRNLPRFQTTPRPRILEETTWKLGSWLKSNSNFCFWDFKEYTQISIRNMNCKAQIQK